MASITTLMETAMFRCKTSWTGLFAAAVGIATALFVGQGQLSLIHI